MTKQNDEVRVSPASQALERSIRRALRNHKRAQKKLKTDPVHDFRVALRRCRSLAEASAVNKRTGRAGPGVTFQKAGTTRQERGSQLAKIVSTQTMEALVAPAAGKGRTYPGERAAAGPVGSRAIDKRHRSPRALDQAAKRGDLARAARHGEALPVHGRKF